MKTQKIGSTLFKSIGNGRIRFATNRLQKVGGCGVDIDANWNWPNFVGAIQLALKFVKGFYQSEKLGNTERDSCSTWYILLLWSAEMNIIYIKSFSGRNTNEYGPLSIKLR